MKILESTEEQLVIGREEPTSDFELICLAVGVNILVTFCFVAIPKNLFPLSHSSFAISFAIGWLLVHNFFPRNKTSYCYLFIVTFSSVPFLGVAFLSLSAISLLQFPQIASLTFEKSRNLLTIKYSKILFWYPSVQYPLNQIVEAALASKVIFIGSSAGVSYIQVVQLARRKQNGKMVWKSVLVGVGQDTVHQINKFLSRSL